MAQVSLAVLAAICGLAVLSPAPAAGKIWRELVVAPENRCSHYNRKTYPYPQSVEPRIIASMGGRIYGPYTGRSFSSRRQTDIEHMVATSEAHDSGLCASSLGVRRAFAKDLLNLTLAAPAVNRCGRKGKCGKDAAEWMPPRNRCWFAARTVEVRQKYKLTIDRREAEALEKVLSGCTSTQLIFYSGTPASVSGKTGSSRSGSGSSRSGGKSRAGTAQALQVWDDNNNGRITCKEARRHGIAPVHRGHPAYSFMRDGDGDGVVCE